MTPEPTPTPSDGCLKQWIKRHTATEIAARAGHRSVVTVLDRYGHLFPNTEQRLNDKLDEIFTAALAETSGSGQVIDLGR